jgi:hypothetical protein
MRLIGSVRKPLHSELLLGLSLSGSQTLMLLHAEDQRCTLTGGSGISPVISPVACHFNNQRIADTFGQAPILLDGKSLVGGAITNAVFAYNGGAVELNNVKIDKGTVRLEFGGAAANTVRFMAAWEQLENPTAGGFSPNAPVVRTIRLKTPKTLNLTAH